MRMQAILLIVQLLVILIGTRLLPFEKYMWLHFAERALDDYGKLHSGQVQGF